MLKVCYQRGNVSILLKPKGDLLCRFPVNIEHYIPEGPIYFAIAGDCGDLRVHLRERYSYGETLQNYVWQESLN